MDSPLVSGFLSSRIRPFKSSMVEICSIASDYDKLMRRFIRVTLSGVEPKLGVASDCDFR